MRKTWCNPFDAVQHILTRRPDINALAEVESWGHPQRGVQRRKRQLQSKLTSCLAHWLLKSVHKRGGKTAMFLPSMVQSAFPDWGRRNVELSLGTFVTKKKKKRERNNLCFLPILQWERPSLSTFTCTQNINPWLLTWRRIILAGFLLCLL